MAEINGSPQPVFNMLVARQLDDMGTGNATYLMVLLRAAKRAGMAVRIVFAPRRSFSNRPWLTLHPHFEEVAEELVWPQSLRIGATFWSLSPQVWGRFAMRLVKETARRLKLSAAKLTRIHSYLGDPLSMAEAHALAKACDRRKGAIACAEYSPLAPVLPLLQRQKHKSVLLHDLFSMRTQTFKEKSRRPDYTPMTIEEEAELISPADVLFYASANEQAKMQPFASGAIPLWLRPEVPEYRLSQSAGTPRAVFLGTRHAGNTDALHHLVDEIWPRVRSKSPRAELWVVGSIASDLSPAQAKAPGVKPVGKLEDLSSIGGPASIGLAPTRIASGVSIKVAEYLRLGMPTIAYPVALEGFGSSLDDLIDVMRSPEAFADRIVALMNDEAMRTARSARGYEEAARRLDNSQVVDYLRSAGT